MKIYVADKVASYPVIELISKEIGLFQNSIPSNLLSQSTSLQKCDAILVPHDAFYFHKNKNYIAFLNKLSKDKPIIFSDRGDFPKNTRFQMGIALRVAVAPGEQRSNKILVPYNVESLDFLPYNNYTDKPRLSFVGYLPKLSMGRLYRSILHTPSHPLQGNGAYVRKRTIRKIKKLEFETYILERDTYGASRKTARNLDVSRNEYLDSISDSDFVLSPRGDANQSARFYEALSCGRLPIVPNSRMQFPVLNQDFPDILLPLLNLKFGSTSQTSKVISNVWERLEGDATYKKTQMEIREFFKDTLDFNLFMGRFFRSSMDEVLESSRKSNST
jgi:hypothetical protein